MKVGILTFHRATNFGTALQAFATEQGIKKLNAEAHIIDYRPSYIERTLQKRKLKNAKSLKEVASICVNSVIYPKMVTKKAENFKRFFEQMDISQKVCQTRDDVVAVSEDYDVIVSGSDQLFNRNITGNDMMYFLPFWHKRKVTFASSFGERKISKERMGEIAPFLSDFTHLSVREESSKDIVTQSLEIIGERKAVTQVLDPTFLLNKEQWSQYADSNLKLPKDGYILTYYMIETPLLRAITKSLQLKTGLKVVNLKPSKMQMLLHTGKNLPNAGPAQFLQCYKNASYVVTNSFHGTAFAINYSIPFFTSTLPVSMAGEVNARLTDMCTLFDLENRWIDSEKKLNNTDLTKPFESHAEKIKNRLREHSFEYLKYALCE